MLRKAAASLARSAFLRAGSSVQTELQRLVDRLVAALDAEVFGFGGWAMRLHNAAFRALDRRSVRCSCNWGKFISFLALLPAAACALAPPPPPAACSFLPSACSLSALHSLPCIICLGGPRRARGLVHGTATEAMQRLTPRRCEHRGTPRGLSPPFPPPPPPRMLQHAAAGAVPVVDWRAAELL